MPYPWRLFSLFIISFLVTSSAATEKSQTGPEWIKLHEDAKQLEKSGASSEAVAKYEKSLKIAEDSGDQHGIGENLLALGRIKTLLGQYDSAIKLIQNAKELGERSKDKKIFAGALVQIGELYERQSQYKESMSAVQQALRISEELNDKALLSKAHRLIGKLQYDQGHFSEAMESLKKSLNIANEAGDSALMCYSLLGLGSASNELGDLDEAIKYLLQALEKAEQAGDKVILPAIYSGIGNAYNYRAMYEEASEYYRRGLEAMEKAGDKEARAKLLNNLATISIHQGLADQALFYLQQSLKIAEELRILKGVALVQSNIGNVYRREGLYEKALIYYMRALETRLKLGDQPGIAATLTNMSLIYINQKNYDRALEYEVKALKIAEETQSKQDICTYSFNVGYTYLDMNLLDKAKSYFDKALTLSREINIRDTTCYALEGIGTVFFKLQKYNNALEVFQQALVLSKEVHAAKLMWQLRYDLAQTYEKLGKTEQAFQFYQEAIDEIDRVRSRSSSEEGKSAFLADKIEVYESLIRFLFELEQKHPKQNYGALAFDISERAKARALLDNLAEFRSGIRKGLTKQQTHTERSLLLKISRIQSQLWEPSNEQKQKQFKSELETAETELDQFILDLKINNPEYAQLKYPEPYKAKLVQKQLDENTAVLEYFLGETNSYVFAMNSKAIQVASLPPKARLNEIVKKYQQSINNPPKTSLGRNEKSIHLSYQQQASSLFRMLIQPVYQMIDGKQNLILVLDGMLHYLPFETLLMDGDRLMLETFKISYAPSLTVWMNLKTKSNRQNSMELIAFGDPILPTNPNGSEDFVGSWIRHLGQLRYARQEVEGIASLFPQNSVEIYLAKEANESKLNDQKISTYRIIHFATHAMIDEDAPRRSGVILSPDSKGELDGIMQMHEIWNLDLNAQLVVLSACQTGLGKLVTGEGMVSFMRAFFYAGANNVVVSLWNVDDKSTAELMKSFYAHMKSGKTETESLRQAKLDMITSAKSGSSYTAYSAAYYWAPFVLIGKGK